MTISNWILFNQIDALLCLCWVHIRKYWIDFIALEIAFSSKPEISCANIFIAPPAKVSTSPGQLNLMKTYHNESNTKIALKNALGLFLDKVDRLEKLQNSDF